MENVVKKKFVKKCEYYEAVMLDISEYKWDVECD